MEFINSLFETMMAFVSEVKITYIIDIGIIAFVFYKLLGLIRETRAEQLVKGFSDYTHNFKIELNGQNFMP